MRIAIIIYGSLDTLTGGYIYNKILVDYLESQGVEVKIFSQSYKSFLGLIWNNFSKKFLIELTQFSPDVVLQDQMNFISLFLLNRKIKKICHFPIISIVHLLHSNTCKNICTKFVIKKIEKLYLKSVSGFIFNSYHTKEAILSIVKTNIKSIVAYPGKDRLMTKDNGQNVLKKNYDQPLKIIFIGNLFYNKGLHVLIEALSQIDKSHWILSVIGALHLDKKYSDKIFDKIFKLKLHHNVKILGQLDTQDLSRQLLLHDLLAVPSYYESFGIVYAEAMGAGLPIIATQSGGAKEIVMDDINGFLIPPGDVTILKEVIAKFIKNKQLLFRMSVCSLNIYAKMPSWQETMSGIYSFICASMRP